MMTKHYLELDKFKLFYANKAAAESIINGIFSKNYLSITLKNPYPYIIDCGSHIGISIMFFKKHYPDSTILSFEPDPDIFQLLKKNITINKLNNVTLINKG
jgi:tRNA1(Val) A37 N6-methylase TrmN6